MKRPRAWLALALALASSACQKPEMAGGAPKPSASGHSDEPAHEGLPSHIRLSDAVVASAGIATAPARKAVLSPILPLPGELAADPDRSARVSSPVAGRIERVDFKEGSTVKKGDVLAIIRILELGKLRAAYATAGAKAKASRLNSERLKALVDKRLASDQEAINADAEASALEIEARGYAEQLSALGGGAGASTLTLRAPVSGVVLSRDAVIGQPVTPEQTIASLADLSELWFLARVFEKDLGRVRVGAQADVQLNAYPAEHFAGTVEYLGRQVDPVARTVTARIRLKNRDDLLRISLFGTASVGVTEGAARPATLVVPESAVTEVAGKRVVFVRQADGDFEQHAIVTGDSALGQVQVLSGLREGEQVVVEGAFTLKSATLKSTFAEGDE